MINCESMWRISMLSNDTWYEVIIILSYVTHQAKNKILSNVVIILNKNILLNTCTHNELVRRKHLVAPSWIAYMYSSIWFSSYLVKCLSLWQITDLPCQFYNFTAEYRGVHVWQSLHFSKCKGKRASCLAFKVTDIKSQLALR